MGESNVASINRTCEVAQKVRKERGGNYTLAEKFAMDVIDGKREVSAAERTMSIKYLLELDLLRKKQRLSKPKKNKEVQAEDGEVKSTITPELEKRLASFGESEK